MLVVTKKTEREIWIMAKEARKRSMQHRGHARYKHWKYCQLQRAMLHASL